MKLYEAISVPQYAKICIKLPAEPLISYMNANTVRHLPKLMEEYDSHFDAIMLDSGAYTAWRKGKEISIEAYAEFIHSLNLPRVDTVYVVNLDVIPGNPGVQITSDQVEESAELSLRNCLRLKQLGIISMPVYHQGERLYWLDKIAEEFDYCGVSPANDKTPGQRLAWCDWVFDHMATRYPLLKSHGFGVTTIGLMKRYPWYSCDSATAVLLAGKSGTVRLPRRSDDGNGYDFLGRGFMLNCAMNKYTGALRQNKDKGLEAEGFFGTAIHLYGSGRGQFHVGALTPDQHDYIEEYIGWAAKRYPKIGFTFDGVVGHHVPRIALNMVYDQEFSKTFVYQPQANTVNVGFFKGEDNG